MYESENPDQHDKGDANPYKNEDSFCATKICLEHESVNVHIGIAAEVVLPLADLTLIENTWLKCDIMTPVFLTTGISEPYTFISVVDPDPYWECGLRSMRIEIEQD